MPYLFFSHVYVGIFISETPTNTEVLAQFYRDRKSDIGMDRKHQASDFGGANEFETNFGVTEGERFRNEMAINSYSNSITINFFKLRDIWSTLPTTNG